MNTINRILNLIKENKSSKYRVIKDCSLQSNTFTYWKNGRATPSLDALIKIADYFNVSLDYLVGRETQSSNITSINADTAELLAGWKNLTQSQQQRILGMIQGLQGLPNNINNESPMANAIRKGEALGRAEVHDKQKNTGAKMA